MRLSPAIILTIGSAMTFASLFYSPETKDLHWDEVGESTSGIEGTEFEPGYAGQSQTSQNSRPRFRNVMKATAQPWLSSFIRLQAKEMRCWGGGNRIAFDREQ